MLLSTVTDCDKRCHCNPIAPEWKGCNNILKPNNLQFFLTYLHEYISFGDYSIGHQCIPFKVRSALVTLHSTWTCYVCIVVLQMVVALVHYTFFNFLYHMIDTYLNFSICGIKSWILGTVVEWMGRASALDVGSNSKNQWHQSRKHLHSAYEPPQWPLRSESLLKYSHIHR